MERCIFCGWTRRTAFPSVRFFQIPREPGMKQIMWMHAIAKKDVTLRDRVCSVHFRQAKPSSDPTHEDFVPHLYLNSEPPPEVILRMEMMAEQKHVVKEERPHQGGASFQTQFNPSDPTRLEVSRVSRPSILRKRPSQPGSSGARGTSFLAPAESSPPPESTGGRRREVFMPGMEIDLPPSYATRFDSADSFSPHQQQQRRRASPTPPGVQRHPRHQHETEPIEQRHPDQTRSSLLSRPSTTVGRKVREMFTTCASSLSIEVSLKQSAPALAWRSSSNGESFARFPPPAARPPPSFSAPKA